MTAHYLYRCYAADGRLLYVGESINAISRIEFHHRNAFWGSLIATADIRVMPNRSTALHHEKVAIRTEGPRFNNQGRWCTRGTWTREDYEDYTQALLGGTAWYTKASRCERLFKEYRWKFGCEHPSSGAIRELFAQHEVERERDRQQRERDRAAREAVS